MTEGEASVSDVNAAFRRHCCCCNASVVVKCDFICLHFMSLIEKSDRGATFSAVSCLMFSVRFVVFFG